ncbi:MAG: hypothetical protein NC453_26070, partial [Muribaculum sp.]|nr:hypothetical protein [Muribaculum sp.]
FFHLLSVEVSKMGLTGPTIKPLPELLPSSPESSLLNSKVCSQGVELNESSNVGMTNMLASKHK